MTRLVSWLLLLLPAGFRNEYAAQMVEAFEQDWRSRSALGRVGMILETAADLVTTAASAHWDAARQDLRYAWRTLRRSPGFALTAVGVMAIGIGATTAAFSLADHVLFRRLPFPAADRLVELWEDQSPASYSTIEPSPPNYRDWKTMSHSFEMMAAYHGVSITLESSGGEPQLLEGAAFTADMLPMLGAQPALGRGFSAEDDRYDAPGTLLLSDRLWHERFGADPAIVGRKVRLDGEPFEVIGVMPRDFIFPRRDVLFWTPARFRTEDWADRTNNWLHVIGRLKPGVSFSQAASEMRTIGARLQRAYPKENAHVSVSTEAFSARLLPRNQRNLFLTLLGAALCVLAVACLNLANLLLLRAIGRNKELAVRTALGAGREHFLRHILAESALIGLIGGTAGVVLAFAMAPCMQSLVPLALPISAVPQVNGRVLLFSLLVTATTALVSGALPALRSSSVNANALQEGARSGIGGRRERVRQALVSLEVASSVTLLVCSGLLLRALQRVQETDPGFRVEGILTARTSLPMPKYTRTARRNAFYNQVLEGVRRLPGVEAAAYTSFLPIVMRGGIWNVQLPGRPAIGVGTSLASMRFITPDYFRTLQIPLLAGRVLQEQDGRDSMRVAVVSASFQKRFWPGESALGKKFLFAGELRTVVGIVGNIRVRGLERWSEPQVYLPYRQQPDGDVIWYAPKDLVIRANSHVRFLVPELRTIIRRADPQQAVSDIQEMKDIIAAELLPRSIQVRMIGAFAVIAFLLAGVGIHGLLSFAVTSRRQELGVRLALGARPRTLVMNVFAEAVTTAAVGAAVGLLGAYVAGLSIRPLLANVQPADPLSYLAALLLTVVMVLSGSLWPAARAARIDPVLALRAN